MAGFKKIMTTLLAAVVVLGILYFVVTNWGFVFSQSIEGTIVAVERVTPPVAIVNNGVPGTSATSGMFSFAVAVRDAKGVIHTASSEDRQWAVARAGNCVTATFYPYAPWKLKKDGTYYNARLDQLRDCATGGASDATAASAATGAADPATPPAAAPTSEAVPAVTPAQ